ncbi:MAG: T9SS type A sorting domain-containing protein, partial [Bacteroidales bacterium]|nr:T9SS type A sorting domain-containing protein [Bacteroidales bacterium]
DDDKNEDNDTFATTIIHYEPLTVADLPFVSDFINPDDRKQWSSTEGNGWMPNEYLGCLWPDRVNVPLLSRCITLDPGTYRFDYGYTAGWEIAGFLFIDSFYVTYGKVGEDPLTWAPVKSYGNMITFGTVIDDDIILNITESGDYMVAVVSVILGDVAIWHTSISEVKTHDVRMKNALLTESFPRIIPKDHFAGNKTIPVTVANRGMSAESGVVSASIDKTAVGEKDFYIESYKDTVVPLAVNLYEHSVGDITVSIMANINNNNDGTPDDNILLVDRIISDSIFAFDNTADNLSVGFGTGSLDIRVGLIYELSVADTLTSVNVAFCPSPYDVNFGLAVYPVNDNNTVGDAYFSIQQRNVSGVSHSYSVPNTVLQAGRYFFEIRDLSQNSFYLASDVDPYGHFYVKEANSPQLSKIENQGLGYIHVRPNFGVVSQGTGIKEIQVSDAKMFVYPNPNTGEFTVTVPETSTVDIFNATGVKVATQSVSESAKFLLKQSGVYMVKATAKNGRNVVMKKIIVK